MSPAELAEHRPPSDATHCCIHDCELIAGQSPVYFGFPGGPNIPGDISEYNAAWTTMFYYARSWVPGDCSTASGRPSTRDVLYCPRCRESEQAYINAQNRTS